VVLLTNDRDMRILLQEEKDLVLRLRGDSRLIRHREGEDHLTHPGEGKDPQKHSLEGGIDLLIHHLEEGGLQTHHTEEKYLPNLRLGEGGRRNLVGGHLTEEKENTPARQLEGQDHHTEGSQDHQVIRLQE